MIFKGFGRYLILNYLIINILENTLLPTLYFFVQSPRFRTSPSMLYY